MLSHYLVYDVVIQEAPLDALFIFIYLFIYLLGPKAAQHNITMTKTEEKHKKLKTKIHKN